jgi:S1-C subfamily serine protease
VASVAVLALFAVLVGMAAGHAIWGTSTHLTAQPTTGSASGSTTSPFGGGSGSVAPYGDGSQYGYGSPYCDGSSTNGSSGSGSVASSSALSTVADGLVNINVTIGSQGKAAATGIVLTSNGEVLTNNHVVNGATTISATDLGNGQTYQATVVGYDRTADIAVIQLSGASGLKTAPLGSSTSVAVGDGVVALGNAGGTGTPTAASGSVTGLDRSITASDEGGGNAERLTGLIEVDAGIQPGDSGGALVDQSGNVIGVNTAASAGYSFQGTTDGYAVPIDTALSLAGQIENGDASATVHIGATAFLGVAMSSTSGQSGFFGGQSNLAGATIAGVQSGSPAAQAGLAAGDTIVAIDGATIDSSSTLVAALGTHHPGDKVTVTWVDQSGSQHSASVTLASGPAA